MKVPNFELIALLEQRTFAIENDLPVDPPMELAYRQISLIKMQNKSLNNILTLVKKQPELIHHLKLGDEQ